MSPKHSLFLAPCLLAPCLLAACSGGSSPGEPDRGDVSELPNVVLITLDTTRADRLGSYGYQHAHTETLDALANGGRRYVRAYSHIPLTIPSHASIFTGRLPAELGIRDNGHGLLSEDEHTLAEVLQESGYTTGAVVAAYVTSRTWGFSQGFDVFMDPWEEATAGGGSYWHAHVPAEEVIDRALAWRKQAPTDKPEFLWVHVYDAHFPYIPPEAYTGTGRPYDAELAYIDDQIQRLVESYQGEPTLFVVVGDHGESLGEHGEMTHGMFVYDATQHVPFFMSGPGIEPAVIEEPVGLRDVTPTVLTQLGLPVPQQATGRATPGTDAEPVFMEVSTLEDRFGLAPHRGVVDGDFKLIDVPRPELYDLTGDPGELTDLAADRAETVARLESVMQQAPPAAVADDQPDAEMVEQLAALGYVDPLPPAELDGSRDPKDHVRLLGLVQRSQKQQLEQKTDEAEATLRTLVAEYPDIPEHRMRLAQLLTKKGEHEEALVNAEKTLEMAPGNHVALSLVADAMTRAGKFEEAAPLWIQLADRRDWDPRARAQAVAAMLTGEPTYKQGLEQGEAWLEQFPDDVHLASLMGVELARKGELGKAERYLRRAMATPRPEQRVALSLARMALQVGRLDEAEELIKLELQHYPSSLDAVSFYVELLARTERWSEVLVQASPILDKEVVPTNVLHATAQAHFNMGDYASARPVLDRALAADPESANLVVLDANLMLKEGKSKEEAQARFDQAQKLAQAAADKAKAAQQAALEQLKERQAAEGTAAEGTAAEGAAP